MAAMSRAIRLELEKHGSTMKDIPYDVLVQYVQITGAFYADLLDEFEHRTPPTKGDHSGSQDSSGE